jgi:hypothetical protein
MFASALSTSARSVFETMSKLGIRVNPGSGFERVGYRIVHFMDDDAPVRWRGVENDIF